MSRKTACAAAAPALLSLGALAAGFGLMLAPGAAAAQQDQAPVPPMPPASAPADAEVPVITIKGAAEDRSKDSLRATKTSIGKGRQNIRDIPQSVTVMTEKLIDDATLDTLKQALHYSAGITFAATENGTDQDIRMRGFPVATTGDLLIDGMKDPSQYDRDSFNYDRIEVMRGAASMLFGRGSTGGVINQVTKKPQLADLTEVVTTFGTGENLRFTGDFNKRLGESSALRINAMVQNATNAGAAIDKRGIAPTVTWGIGSRDEITLGLFHLEVDNVPMSGLRYLSGSVAAGIPARNFYGTASDDLRGEASYGSGIWTHRFGDDDGELRTQFRSGRYRRSAWGTTASHCGAALTAAGICPAGAPAVTAETLTSATALTRSGLTPRSDVIDGTYLQSDYSRKFSWLGMRHEFLAGIDAGFESASRDSSFGVVGPNFNKGGTTVGTPNDGRQVEAAPTFRKTSDFKGRAIGAYVQDLVTVAPHWKLLAGTRWDRFEADTNQISYTGDPNAPISTVNTWIKYRWLLSGRAGVLFQPSPDQSYHLSYGTAFNTSADTYQYVSQDVITVPAEKSRNLELGAKLDWLEGQLSTRLALYRTEKFNERTTDADFAGTFPVLSGKRHAQGFEVDVVGRLTPAIEVYVSYSHVLEAKIDKAGSAVAAGTAGSDVGLSPRHTGAAWVSYQVSPRIRIAAGARGASRNRPLQGGTGAASTTAHAPGYVACDAMAEYTFDEDVFARLNVTNLTNKVYGDQLYPVFYTPGEARTIKFTLGYRF
ncbi:MAG: TonB-dependent siderophore receptor [Rubrivivax sp.]